MKQKTRTEQVLLAKSATLCIRWWIHIWLNLCNVSLVMYYLSTFDVSSVALQVVITQMNGADHPSESIHVLHVGKMRIKLCKGKATIAKEYYSTSMQVLCIIFIYLSFQLRWLEMNREHTGPRMFYNLSLAPYFSFSAE